MKTLYVAATDKLLSGWGCCENKKSRVIVECNGWDEVARVERNLERQKGMVHVNHYIEKPYYAPSRYVVSEYNKDNASLWFR